MKITRILSFILALLLCATVFSFAGGKPEKTVVIGFIPMTMNNEYFVTMVNAAKIEAQKQGVELLVQAGERHGSADEQLRIIEDMITREVSAICVVPSSSTGLISAIKKAQAAGIPVINLDTRIDPAAVKEAGLKSVPYIGTNNYDGAKMGGEYALAKLGIAGKEVAVLTGISGQQNAADRRNGFVDSTKGKVTVVAEQTANWEVEQGYNVFQNILQANPKVGFVFASNDNMGLGALRAAKEAGRDDIIVLGYDAIGGALEAVEKGDMAGTVAQFPAEMGIQGVQAALKAIKGQSVPEITFTKTQVIDKVNVAEFKKYLDQYK